MNTTPITSDSQTISGNSEPRNYYGFEGLPIVKEPHPLVIIGYAFSDEILEGTAITYLSDFRLPFWHKTQAAISHTHIQLFAISWLLNNPFQFGNLTVATSDEFLMGQLGGEDFENWKKRNWKWDDGCPMKHGKLLARIEKSMRGRRVRFVADSTYPKIETAQDVARVKLFKRRQRLYGE